jgi:hypothetical protein
VRLNLLTLLHGRRSILLLTIPFADIYTDLGDFEKAAQYYGAQPLQALCLWLAWSCRGCRLALRGQSCSSLAAQNPLP